MGALVVLSLTDWYSKVVEADAVALTSVAHLKLILAILIVEEHHLLSDLFCRSFIIMTLKGLTGAKLN
jgi:hypothetical protein